MQKFTSELLPPYLRKSQSISDLLPALYLRGLSTVMVTFAPDYEAKYPKAAKSPQTEADTLTTHFDFPAEHWKHLRTTNPSDSTFAMGSIGSE